MMRIPRFPLPALRGRWARLWLAACTLALAGPALAQQPYPAKAIKMVIPYPVGGSADQVGRLLADSLSQQLGQPIIVENRAGAGGLLAHQFVAAAPADGYTLLLGAAGPLTVTPQTYGKLTYDPIKGFIPITLVATQPLLLVVNPELGVSSLADLIGEARRRPGQMTYGSFGSGSAAHLAGEYFKTLAGVSITHVPYKGSPPALVDLMAGQIDMMFDVFSNSTPLVKTGKLRALAITSAGRSPQFPDVPTMQEAGIAGFEAGTWFGVLAPAGTPRPVIDTLSRTINAALARPELVANLESQGATVRGGTPGEFERFFLAEYDKWGKVVRQAGLKAD